MTRLKQPRALLWFAVVIGLILPWMAQSICLNLSKSHGNSKPSNNDSDLDNIKAIPGIDLTYKISSLELCEGLIDNPRYREGTDPVDQQYLPLFRGLRIGLSNDGGVTETFLKDLRHPLRDSCVVHTFGASLHVLEVKAEYTFVNNSVGDIITIVEFHMSDGTIISSGTWWHNKWNMIFPQNPLVTIQTFVPDKNRHLLGFALKENLYNVISLTVVTSHDCDCNMALLELAGGPAQLNIKEEYLTYLGEPFLTVWTYPQTSVDVCAECTTKCGTMQMEVEATPMATPQPAISFPGAVYITSWYSDNYEDLGYKVFDVKITLTDWPSVEFHLPAPFIIGECVFSAYFADFSKHEGKMFTYTLWQETALYIPLGTFIEPPCPKKTQIATVVPVEIKTMAHSWVQHDGALADSYCTKPELALPGAPLIGLDIEGIEIYEEDLECIDYRREALIVSSELTEEEGNHRIIMSTNVAVQNSTLHYNTFYGILPDLSFNINILNPCRTSTLTAQSHTSPDLAVFVMDTVPQVLQIPMFCDDVSLDCNDRCKKTAYEVTMENGDPLPVYFTPTITNGAEFPVSISAVSTDLNSVGIHRIAVHGFLQDYRKEDNPDVNELVEIYEIEIKDCEVTNFVTTNDLTSIPSFETIITAPTSQMPVAYLIEPVECQYSMTFFFEVTDLATMSAVTPTPASFSGRTDLLTGEHFVEWQEDDQALVGEYRVKVIATMSNAAMTQNSEVEVDIKFYDVCGASTTLIPTTQPDMSTSVRLGTPNFQDIVRFGCSVSQEKGFEACGSRLYRITKVVRASDGVTLTSPASDFVTIVPETTDPITGVVTPVQVSAMTDDFIEDDYIITLECSLELYPDTVPVTQDMILSIVTCVPVSVNGSLPDQTYTIFDPPESFTFAFTQTPLCEQTENYSIGGELDPTINYPGQDPLVTIDEANQRISIESWYPPYGDKQYTVTLYGTLSEDGVTTFVFTKTFKLDTDGVCKDTIIEAQTAPFKDVFEMRPFEEAYREFQLFNDSISLTYDFDQLCGPQDYTVVYADGRPDPMPFVVVYDKNSLIVSVLPDDPIDHPGTYDLHLVVSLTHFPSITHSEPFEVNVGPCYVRSFGPKPPTHDQIYSISDPPVIFEFNFAQDPPCQKKVEYFISVNQTQYLPKFMTHAGKTITVASSDPRDAGLARFNITAKIENLDGPRYSSQFFDVEVFYFDKIVSLNPLGFSDQLEKQIITVGKHWFYSLPEAFDNSGDPILYNVTFSSKQLEKFVLWNNVSTSFQAIGPTVLEEYIGEHFVVIQLFSGTQRPWKKQMTQTLFIEVVPDPEPESGLFRFGVGKASLEEDWDLESVDSEIVYIKSIDRWGDVDLRFKAEMVLPTNIASLINEGREEVIRKGTRYRDSAPSTRRARRSLINPQKTKGVAGAAEGMELKKAEDYIEIMTVEVEPGFFSNVDDLNFTWNMTEATNTSMKIRLYFEKPLLVSSGMQPDFLKVKLWDTREMRYFKPEVGPDQKQLGLAMLTIDLESDMITQTFETVKPGATDLEQLASMMPWEVDQEYFEQLANVFLIVTTVVIVENFLFNTLMLASLTLIWSMINQMQIILHFPLIDLPYPPNIILFISKLMRIANFEVVETNDWLEEVFNLTPTDPYSSSFNALGYEKRNFVQNLGPIYFVIMSAFTMLVIVGFLYTFQDRHHLLDKAYTRLSAILCWNYFIRLFLESYLDILICSVLAVSVLEHNNFWDAASWAFGLVCLGLALLLPIIFLVLFIRHRGNLVSESVFSKYGALYLDLKAYSVLSLTFVFQMLMKRIILVAVIMWMKHPVFQIFVLMALVLLVILYHMLNMPFLKDHQNYLEIFNEIMGLFFLQFMLLFTHYVDGAELRYRLGTSAIILLIVFIAVNLLVMLGEQLVLLYQNLRRKYFDYKMDQEFKKEYLQQVVKGADDKNLEKIQKVQEALKKRREYVQRQLVLELSQSHQKTKVAFQLRSDLEDLDRRAKVMEYVTGGGQNASVSAATETLAPERVQAILLEAKKGEKPNLNDLSSIEEEEKSGSCQVSEVSEPQQPKEGSLPKPNIDRSVCDQIIMNSFQQFNLHESSELKELKLLAPAELDEGGPPEKEEKLAKNKITHLKPAQETIPSVTSKCEKRSKLVEKAQKLEVDLSDFKIEFDKNGLVKIDMQKKESTSPVKRKESNVSFKRKEMCVFSPKRQDSLCLEQKLDQLVDLTAVESKRSAFGKGDGKELSYRAEYELQKQRVEELTLKQYSDMQGDLQLKEKVKDEVLNAYNFLREQPHQSDLEDNDGVQSAVAIPLYTRSKVNTKIVEEDYTRSKVNTKIVEDDFDEHEVSQMRKTRTQNELEGIEEEGNGVEEVKGGKEAAGKSSIPQRPPRFGLNSFKMQRRGSTMQYVEGKNSDQWVGVAKSPLEGRSRLHRQRNQSMKHGIDLLTTKDDSPLTQPGVEETTRH